VKVTAWTLAEVRGLAGHQGRRSRRTGAAMTAALGPGWVLAEDQPRQEPGHDIGADPGS